MESGRISPKQARDARLLLGWRQRDVAAKASISNSCVSEAERGFTTDIMLARLRAVYESAGVELTNGGQPGVRMKKVDPSPDTIPVDDLNASNDE
jgi:transcriptional regulator with XRE-family HTH domain